MRFNKENYHEVGARNWDKVVTSISGSTYLNSSYIIDYFCAFSCDITNNSFVVYNDKRVAVSVCTIFLGKNSNSVNSYSTLPYSAISITDSINPGDRRKLLKFIFNEIDFILSANKNKLIDFVSHPINVGSILNIFVSSENMFEFQSKCSILQVHNTLISNLTYDENTLIQNMNKYRRRMINQSIKKGLMIKAYCNNDNVYKHISDMRVAHYKSSGSITRSDKTWKVMANNARHGFGTVFVAYSDNGIPVSYLYCGEFYNMAWGWSQVNIKEYEKEWSPRALLEWEAMRYYKEKDYKFYEIGERFYKNSMYNPTEKEVSISEFKERYGVYMYPKIFWRYAL